ncbi:hypothetical protein F4813DRAFT_368025 [Daldinia decipiens]|uniref:uncharacterized protein n=1 Tax=Daldinia decipiens TaxID=326647 RepID=UPI0020C295C6|nr:uncharacterized protein F4813DRAFT_368025 [Daldinia decipiens]KAI1655192.1 hypothetical protein F4813DRAFT_368025 [Daldinia decipiens]
MTSLLLIFAIASLALAQFSNPPPGRVTWKVGDIQSISFKTKFKKFSVALWQEAPQGGSATLGPILFQTVNNAATQFTWLVQAYDFDLNVSSVFFFWMFEGDPSFQGNRSTPQMSSAFFKLSNNATVSNATQTTPPSTSIGQEPLSPTNLDPPAGSSQGEDVQKHSNGLSAGAKAGIGISVSITGLAIITCIGLYIRKLKKQDHHVADEPVGNPQPIPSKETWQNNTVAELDTTQRLSCAELP